MPGGLLNLVANGNMNIILNGNIIASGSLITSKNIKALEDLDVVRNIKVDNNVGLGKSVDTERLSVLGNINVNGNIIIREGLKVDNGTFSIDKENNILRVGTNKKITFDGDTSITEYIYGDGSNIILGTSNDVVINSTTAKLEFGSANSGEYIRGDGNNLIIESGNNINLGSTNDVNIDSGSKINFLRTSTNYVEYTFDTHINYQCGLNRDLIFKINNSDTVASIARFDASANTFAMERNKKLTFDGETDQNEYIYGDGNSLNIGSANDVIINSANDVVINSGSSKLEFGSANSGTHINGNGIDMYANTQRDIHMVSANVVIHGNLELKGEGTGEFTISNNPSNPSADTSFMNFVSHPSNDNVVKDTSTPGEFSFAKFAKITLNGTPYWMQLFQFTS